MADRKLVVEIIGDNRSLSRALTQSARDTQKFSVGLGTLVKSAAVFSVVDRGISAISSSLRSGVSEWQETVTVAAQTQAVLKSTGGIANVGAKGVDALASKLSRLSGIDDEAIAAGENLLLTFKNVRNELGKGNQVFDRAAASALNLSVAGFGSLDSTSKQLGKALNDPVKGMTALGRAGVTFTQGQRDTIKALVESNDLLGAQKLILREVESQVGGSAKALGQTLPGQLNRLKETAKNALGGLVGAATPALTSIVDDVNDFVDDLSQAKTARAKVNVVLTAAQDLGRQALEIAGEVLTKVGEALDRIDWSAVGQRVGDGLSRALDGLSAFIGRVDWGKLATKIVQGIVNFLKGVDWVALLKSTVVLLVKAVIAFDRFLYSAAFTLGKAVLGGIVAGIKALAGLVGDEIRKIPAQFKQAAKFLAVQAQGLGKAVIDGIGTGLDNAKDFVLQKLLAFVNKILGVTSFLGRFDPFKGVREKVQKSLKAMEADTATSIGNMQRTIQSLEGKTVTVTVKTKVEAPQTTTSGGGTNDRTNRIVEQQSGTAGIAQAARAAAEREAQEQRAAAAEVARRQEAARDAARRAAARARRIREQTIKAFGELMGALGLDLEKAQVSKSFRDDLAVLQKQLAAVDAEVKVEGKTLDLMRERFRITQDIADVQKQIAQAQADRRKADQFKALGLTADGSERVASIGAIRKRGKSLISELETSGLDENQVAKFVKRISVVFAKKFDGAGRDIREAILGMYRDIADALKGEGGSGAAKLPRTPNASNLFKNIGLDPEEIKKARREVARAFGGVTGGSKVGGAFGFGIRPASVTATSGGAGVVINGPITVVTNDPDEFIRKLERKQQRTSQARTGTSAGRRL